MVAASVEAKDEPLQITANKSRDSVLENLGGRTDAFPFNIIDLALLIFSVFSIISDLFTDLVLVIEYSNQGYKAWATGTFVLIFFPSLIVQFFSLRWHIVDKTASVLHWVLHFCMLGIIHRYVQIIKAAIAAYKSKSPSDIQKVFLEQSDLCMLHLFESFLESAPQLVLQMYVIAMLHEWRFWTGLSALASLLSLAWALAAYTKAQRRARPNKNFSSWPGLLLQAIWRTGMLTSRISTLVLGAYCFGNYIFLILGIHWVVMTTWIISQKTDFCETYWEERIYNGVIGVIYCFCFFNLQEGQSRWRVLAFYLVIVFQNLSCLTIFLMQFGEQAPKLAVSGFIAIVGGTMLGAVSMLVYYRFFHPSGPIKLLLRSKEADDQNTFPPYSSMTLRSLKRMRCESQSEASQNNTPQSDPKQLLKAPLALSDSIVIVEENVLDETDVDMKILRDWINEDSDKKQKGGVSDDDKDGDAYKRRAICSSVDLVKLIESSPTADEGGGKLAGPEEASSDVLSAHDYENLCAVNIAREVWGLRSWRGYSDIETWLHDDSVVHDRRLDTLTSTTGSERSGNTQRENERTRQDDYIDAIAEDLAQCESEASSDDVLGQYALESLPVVYPLSTLDPIFEEIEESSNASTEFADPGKMRTGSASTLVATIDEIRRNTPTQSRYQRDGICDCFSPLSDIQPKPEGTWKKVTFATKILRYPGDVADAGSPAENAAEEKVEKTTPEKTGEAAPHHKAESEMEGCDKENIPTVASKIRHWNEILSSQNGSDLPEKVTTKYTKGVNVKGKNFASLMRVLTSPNHPTARRGNRSS